ncbi:MAG: PQQ-binding-like beta-propeller repeat protein [Luteitalea sp.]|nr:PQQ-binding-like beta-propeller repeat protein [Luteitalea sp.]
MRRYRASLHWHVTGVVGSGLLGLAALLAAGPRETPTTDPWLQWGGPQRNFVVESASLARSWPAEGPRRVWSRPLGDGHSAILVDEGRLYTMYRPAPSQPDPEWADEEIVIALDEATGETIWEHRYPARPLDFKFGAGPYATPLIVGQRLFTVGTNNQLFAFDKTTGKVEWSRDLVKELGAQERLIRPAIKAGISSSPLEYGDTLIVMAGGQGQAVMAFDQATGKVVWKSGDFNISQASPILIDVEGETQLVAFGGMDVNGLDPATGRLLWSHAHDTSGDMNISTPLWSPDNLLFVTSAYDGGSRMLRLVRNGTSTRVDEQWFTNRLRVHIGTVIRLDDFIVGSSGDFGPTPMTAIDVKSGELLWQDRSFSRANLLNAGGKLVILDEDGVLGLAEATRTGLEVLARAEDVLTSRAWTVPSLVGSSLYARDRQQIVKIDLPTP